MKFLDVSLGVSNYGDSNGVKNYGGFLVGKIKIMWLEKYFLFFKKAVQKESLELENII